MERAREKLEVAHPHHLKNVARQVIAVHRLIRRDDKSEAGARPKLSKAEESQLSQLPLFRQFGSDLVHKLARCLQVRKFSVDEKITEASHCNLFVFVLGGTAKLCVNGLHVAELRSGQYFGETTLFGLEEKVAAVELVASSGRCTACTLSRDDLLKMLQDHPIEMRRWEDVHTRCHPEHCKLEGTQLASFDIFHDVNEETITDVKAFMLQRLYLPGERIIEEGRPGDALCMVVQGQVDVEIAGRVARSEICGEVEEQEERHGSSLSRHNSRNLHGDGQTSRMVFHPPVCFGQHEVLRTNPHYNCSVIARSVCLVHVVHRLALVNLKEKHPDLTNVNRTASYDCKQLLTAGLGAAPIFADSGCDEAFVSFLADHMEPRVYLAGQTIVEEDSHPRPHHQESRGQKRLYLLATGRVRVHFSTGQGAELAVGSCFGEIPALKLGRKGVARAVAEETSDVEVLHQRVLVRALELFPEQRKRLLAAVRRQVPREVRRASDVDADPVVIENGMVNREYLEDARRKSATFQDFPPAFLVEFCSVGLDRVFMPGDLVVTEGSKSNSMFIMVSGEATVFKRDLSRLATEEQENDEQAEPGLLAEELELGIRMCSINAGSIFGELRMLGIATVRSATVRADTICVFQEIPPEKGLSVIEQHTDAHAYLKKVVHDYLEPTVHRRFQSLPLFAGFEVKFILQLSLRCQRLVAFPGDKIVEEGQVGTQLFIINAGSAMLELDGVALKSYGPGSHFGSAVLLGLQKTYLGTFIAVQSCHACAVSRADYLQAMEEYPSEKAAKRLVKEEKAADAKLREVMKRGLARKLALRRRKTSKELQEKEEESEQRKLAEVFRSWQHVAVGRRQRRLKEEQLLLQKQEEIQQWVRQQSRAREKARERQGEASVPPRSPQAMAPQSARESEQSKVRRHSEQLSAIIHNWKLPSPSPFYQLRMWDVLPEAVGTASIAGPLLPMLAAPESPASPGSTAATPRDAPLSKRRSSLEAQGQGGQVPPTPRRRAADRL